MTDEQAVTAAQKCLDRFGYLVLDWYAALSLGEIIEPFQVHTRVSLHGPRQWFPYRLVVVGDSSLEERQQQMHFLGLPPDPVIPGQWYYRVTAE